jgi:hypothetical protein
MSGDRDMRRVYERLESGELDFLEAQGCASRLIMAWTRRFARAALMQAAGAVEQARF